MYAVRQIQDQGKPRDAIPVRALPWLTTWEFTACAVADAFSRYHYPWAAGINAYRLEDGAIQVVPRVDWRNTIDAKIEELYELHRAGGMEYEELMMATTAALPAGVFVWLDEWEPAYNQSPDGPGVMAALHNDLMESLPPAARGMTPDELHRWNQCVPGFLPDSLSEFKPDEFTTFDDDGKQDADERVMKFGKHMPPDLVKLVKEGFTDDAPEQSPAGDVQPDAAPAQSTEKHTPEPERRLGLLRQMGGDVKYARGAWKVSGIKELVASEKANKRKRCDEKTIRLDLKEAAQNERDAKSAKPFDQILMR